MSNILPSRIGSKAFCCCLIMGATIASASMMAQDGSSGDSKSWTIPIQGNAFCTAPTPKRLLDRRSNGVSWSDEDQVVSLFFRVDKPAKLSLNVTASATEGEATIQFMYGEWTKRITCQNAERSSYALGEIEVKEPGYLEIAITGIERSGTVFPTLHELEVESSLDNLTIDFVRNNDGNMFYWGRRGPSVHLRYGVPNEKKIGFAYSEVTVPKQGGPVGSFFMANGFSEGYFGMQVNSSTERRILFSVWSPFRTDNPKDIPADFRVELISKGDEVHVGEFGNEGSGGQSYLRYPWEEGKTYCFLTEVSPERLGGRTRYTSWFRPKEDPTWQLIASFSRPKTSTHLNGFHSFLENFSPSHGHLERTAAWENVWVNDVDGVWHSCQAARFSVDATGAGRHRLDFAGGSTETGFYLKNGGFLSEPTAAGSQFKTTTNPAVEPKIDFKSLPR